ncbi:craniofacial development protein 1-like isoform X1 [Lolium rigidum]|uniref:craniofacial development protein 1-like isoform X1 n=2 Tax=Lolium rigidum TaxID=89674 RepID=UPI001F5C4DA8|nr:craniofacial development protein 1-like isoform X1 [Lolium rigidum]
MASSSSAGEVGGSGSKLVVGDEILPTSGNANNSEQQLHDTDTKSRVEDVWKKMNSGLPVKMPKPVMNKLNTGPKEKKNKVTNNWMSVLGIAPSKASTINQVPKNGQQQTQHETSEDAKKLAANALAAVRDAAAASGKGKVEITEVRDFAGKDIEIKKLVDADSKEAVEKAKAAGASPSAVDNILEQIRKKQKLSVLDKTKKDWGEYKVENKVEEELGAYKKSSNQYLDRQSFLQRADYREFERERDARLSLMAKRKSEGMQDDDV